MSDRRPILSVRHLTTCFRTDRGIVTAVDDVSFDIFPGETVGIVGESGCGKTVTSKSIMRLLPVRTSIIKPGSEMLFTPNGSSGSAPVNLATCTPKEMREIRGARIAMIFQEPMTSLNPVFRIGWQIEEALKYHTDLDAAGRRKRVLEMLKLVEIPNPEKRIDEYPHQLSGGMRQRVMIAMALACEPSLLIADEPTTALDVTIQAQILDLIAKLRDKLGMSIVLITHDLGVVAEVASHVVVMYAGRVVERASVASLFEHPRHPYTRGLLRSLPSFEAAPAPDPANDGPRRRARLPVIEGIVPDLMALPPGCRFADRCPMVIDDCRKAEPTLDPVLGDPKHLARCIRAEEV